MKQETAIAIGVGCGLAAGALVGGISYAIYKSMKKVLDHEDFPVDMFVGHTATGTPATISHYFTLGTAGITVPAFKFTVPDNGEGAGAILTTGPFGTDLVAAPVLQRLTSATQIKGPLLPGEYIVARVVKDSTPNAYVVFSIATTMDDESSEVPLHPGDWEFPAEYVLTWKSKI